VAEKLFEHGGLEAPIDALAHWLGYKSADNGAFIARIVAARLFGLIEGPPKAVRPTPRAQTIIRPDYETSAIRAKLEAFEAVPLYTAFLQAYEGRPLPPRGGMLNALQNNFGIAEKDVPPVLDRLLESADTAGLFNVTGDRSKMIRPPLAQVSGPEVEAPSDGRLSEAVAPSRTTLQMSDGLKSRGKLLDGLWELLPETDSWDEAQFQTWLNALIPNLRARYRLPDPSKDRG
jgi:hypothetical protein